MGDAVGMALTKTKKTPFVPLGLALTLGTSMLILAYFIVINISGSLPTAIDALPTQTCGGFGPDCGANPITPNDLIQIIFWAGIIIVIPYFVLGLFPLESNFSSFWKRIEESRGAW